MTLRVNIEIVPYGNEDNKYPISRLDISNIGPIGKELPFGMTNYGYDVKLYRYNNEIMRTSLGIPEWELQQEVKVEHVRRDGAIELVRKACEKVSL